MARAQALEAPELRPVARVSRRTVRRTAEAAFWYVVLIAMAIVTVFPFAWILLTSLKGPADPIFSRPYEPAATPAPVSSQSPAQHPSKRKRPQIAALLGGLKKAS